MASEDHPEVADWRAELLSDRTVEAVAGALFALDAEEPIRDERGGWRKERLRRAARTLLDAAVESVDGGTPRGAAR